MAFSCCFNKVHGHALAKKTSNPPRHRVTQVMTVAESDPMLSTVFPPLMLRKNRCFKGKAAKSMEDAFRFDKPIGKSGFSEVWLAQYRRFPKDDALAIRLMSKEECSLKIILMEVAVLKSVTGSPFVVQMHSCFQTPTHFAIVMKFATRGTLHERVKMVRCFSELVARFYAAEISEGLFMLHSKGIIHRDLNLDNILICENGHVVLSNFGYSLQIGTDEIDSAINDPWPDANVKAFLPAPELLLGLVYDKTVDWWSLGIIVYRMVCGEFPFSASTRRVGLIMESSKIELAYRHESYPQYLSMPAKQLISQLLARKRLRRLGSGKYEANAIAGAPFFFHVDWAEIRDYTFPAPFSELVHPAYHREGNRKANMHLPVSYMGPMMNDKLTTGGAGGEGLTVSRSMSRSSIRPNIRHAALSSRAFIVPKIGKTPFLLRAKSWFGRRLTTVDVRNSIHILE